METIHYLAASIGEVSDNFTFTECGSIVMKNQMMQHFLVLSTLSTPDYEMRLHTPGCDHSKNNSVEPCENLYERNSWVIFIRFNSTDLFMVLGSRNETVTEEDSRKVLVEWLAEFNIENGPSVDEFFFFSGTCETIFVQKTKRGFIWFLAGMVPLGLPIILHCLVKACSGIARRLLFRDRTSL